MTARLRRSLVAGTVGLTLALAVLEVLPDDPVGVVRPPFGVVAIAALVVAGVAMPVLVPALVAAPEPLPVPDAGTTASAAELALGAWLASWLQVSALLAYALPLLLITGRRGGALAGRLLPAVAVALAATAVMTALCLAWSTLLRSGPARITAGLLTAAMLWAVPLAALAGGWQRHLLDRSSGLLTVTSGPPPDQRTPLLGCLGPALRPPRSGYDAALWLIATSPISVLADAVPHRTDPGTVIGYRPDNGTGRMIQPDEQGANGVTYSPVYADAPAVDPLARLGTAVRNTSGTYAPGCDNDTAPAWPRGIVGYLLLIATALAVIVGRARRLAPEAGSQ